MTAGDPALDRAMARLAAGEDAALAEVYDLGAPEVLHAWPCGLLTLLIALPLIGIALLVLRGLTLSRPGLVGACLGLAAATWAHLLIRVHCPLGGAGHAILGHLLPLLPLMILGAWEMRRR
jgi:hypothetical protein